ncbi:MAG TPA: DinB family protein [Acidimicrobiia bacterium]|nr:DinB family protein [Acidimicrobiia bacterium]
MYECPECGFTYDRSARQVPDAIAREVATVPELLAAGSSPEVRRDPSAWSPLEYACHMRDVLLVQRERVLASRRVDIPSFESMGREERVEHDGYAEQHVDDVSRQLHDAALLFGRVLDRLDQAGWERRVVYNYPSRQERSVEWVAVHTLHEMVHHIADIRRQLG